MSCTRLIESAMRLDFFEQRSRLLFLLLLTLAAVFKLSFTDRGALALPDEIRYAAALEAIGCLAQGRVHPFCALLHSASARPGDVTVRLLPAAAQHFLYRMTGVPPLCPTSLRIPIYFNVVISLLMIGLFYLISLELFPGNRLTALSGTFVFTFLTTNNIYIRHILPYDCSLAIYLYAILLLLRPGGSMRRYVLVGLLTGFGHLVYPGYYFLPAVVGVVLLRKVVVFPFSPGKAVPLFAFAFSFLAILLLYEMIAWVGGVSYVAASRDLSRTITQGSFEEGFSFPGKYLLRSEWLTGGLLLLLPLLYLLRQLTSVRRTANQVFLMTATCFGLYLYYAIMCTVAHKTVFYGRIVHGFVPFLLLASMAFLIELPSIIHRVGLGILALSTSVSFAFFVDSYSRLAYPRDVLYEQRIDSYEVPVQHKIAEAPGVEAKSPPAPSERAYYSPQKSKNCILVNFGHFFPIPEQFDSFRPPPSAEETYNGRHYQTFLLYSMEGKSIEERARIMERNYRIQIYQIPYNAY